MTKPFFILLLSIFFLSCQVDVKTTTDTQLKDPSPWFHLSPEVDSVAGISLERAYKELISEADGQDIIVAMLDKQVDITHEDLQSQIYTNPNEIPYNKIDDDNNGYVDDIHGWNFLGYGTYNYERHLSFSQVRVINKFANKFKNTTKENVDPKDTLDFNDYNKALQDYEYLKSMEKKWMDLSQQARDEFYNFIKTFNDQIPGHDDYTIEQLDSLTFENEEEEKLAEIMKDNVRYGYTFNYTYTDEDATLRDIYTLNNLKYNDRANIGDDPNDANSFNYGNNNIHAPSHIWHGTQVAGVIAATRNNGIGVQGVSNNIKIMPLVVSPEHGDYKDKDLANAICYAVDNGAKIINFSGSKYDYTENEELLFSALKYADEKGVLFITSAGNTHKNLDLKKNKIFFSSYYRQTDSVNNVLLVGGTTKDLNNPLYRLSNYGKKQVHIFAPSLDIKTTNTLPIKYKVNQGTSLGSALVSGVAALVWSNNPSLTHYELKSILMNSGTELDVLVKITDSVPFKNLSQSGKILNAYNALKMAEQLNAKQ